MKVNNGKMNIFYQNTLWRPGRDGIIELPDSYAGTLRSTPDKPDERECKVVEWPNPESPFHDLRNTTPPARTTGVEVKPEERGQSHSAALDKLNETLAERDAAIKALTDRLAELEKGGTPTPVKK